LPHIAAINEKYQAKGLRVIVADATARKDLTEKMMSELAYTAPVLIDEGAVAREQYKIVGTPTTYLVDENGRIVFKHIGYGPGMERTLEKEIEALLARKSA
jgi:cytochrome oxidase Cu insertion factor (SCO1/SenC/PrrC family)